MAKSMQGKHPIENLAQPSCTTTKEHSLIYDQK